MASFRAASGHDPVTPLSLLDRARAQDQFAWSRVVHLYSPLVYRWCRAAGLQPADADDVGQQVFAAVARNLRAFRRDRPGDTFRGWLHTITHHRLCDHARERTRHATFQPGSKWEATVAAPSEPNSVCSAAFAPKEEERLLFRRALDLLRAEFKETTWRAFVLVIVEQRAPSDVADEVGISLDAVYTAKSRVLKRLREEFADLVDGPLLR